MQTQLTQSTKPTQTTQQASQSTSSALSIVAKKKFAPEAKGRKMDKTVKDDGKVSKVAIRAKVRGRKGGDMYICQLNFTYLVNKKVQTLTGMRTHLKCRDWNKTTKCPSRAWLQEGQDGHLFVAHEHNHVSDAALATATICQHKYREKAIDNPLLKPRAVYGEMVGQRDLLPNERMAFADQVWCLCCFMLFYV